MILLRLLFGAVRGLVVLALTLPVAAGAALLGAAWLLAGEPADLSWALPRAEALLNRAGTAERVSAAGATLSWRGYRDGPASPAELTLTGLRFGRPDEPPAGAAERLRVVLDLPNFLPRAIEAEGAALRLRRAPDGSVAADTAGPATPDSAPADAPDVSEVLRELSRPPASGAAPDGEGAVLRHLRRVRLRNAAVTLRDAEAGGTWRLDLAALSLDRPDGGGLLGDAEATLAVGAARAASRLRAELDPDGGSRLHLDLQPFAAGAVQREAERQGANLGADLGASPGGGALLDAALDGSATLALDPALRPRAAALRLRAGGGRLRVAGAPVGFDALELDAEAAWTTPAWSRPDAAVLKRLRAVLHAPGGGWPSTLLAAATLRRTGAALEGRAEASLDHLALADLGGLWPEPLGGHARPWLVANITGGTARDAGVALAFATTPSGGLALRELTGRVALEDGVVHWLRPVPPAERIAALLTVRSPDALDVAVSAGRQGPMNFANGLVRITGLSAKDQFLALSADVNGSVPDVLALLRHKRLALLDRKPIPMRNPGGAFSGRLGVNLPLNEDLSFEDVKIAARVRATDLRLGGLVAGRDLDRGDVSFDVSSETLKAQGKAAIAGIPAELSVEMDFRPGAPSQVVQRAQATVRAGPEALSRAGLDTAGILEGGQGAFSARYAQRRDGNGEIAVTADLRAAALSLPGWSKPPGAAPADASFRLLLRGDELSALDNLRVRAPGLALDGRAELTANRLSTLVLDAAELGATRASGTIALPPTPAEPLALRLSGPVLDLAPFLSGRAKPAAGTDPPWNADLRFDRVLLAAGADRFLSGVSVRAENRRGRLESLRVASTGPERLDASIARAGNARRLLLTAADGGALLRAADVSGAVDGGVLSVDAAYDDARPTSPLSGTATVRGFRVRDAPILGKLLQAATVFGVVEALSGPGLSFVALQMPFTWDGPILDLGDTEAFSVSLGLTARGRIDTARKAIDVRGTVVPAYAINSVLGRIPLLGGVFSAEKGGGLVAVNYAVRGSLAEPSVSVNPLSALTPGFLRGLFRVFD